MSAASRVTIKDVFYAFGVIEVFDPIATICVMHQPLPAPHIERMGRGYREIVHRQVVALSFLASRLTRFGGG